MGASLLVLLLFQTSLGTLYLRVGFVNALFMAGLGLGSWAAGRWPEARHPVGLDTARGRVPRPAELLAACDALWVAVLLALVPLAGALPSWNPGAREAGLCALAAFLGLLTGMPFPLAAGALRRSGPVAGGIAEAADHAGAVAGALLTGTLLVPLLGFSATLLLLAALKALSLAGALFARSAHAA
jgi:predicted membrane-bound spermidine synthase